MERQPEGKQRLAGRAATEPGQDPEAGRPNARPATPPGLGPIARAGSQADLQALLQIFERCHVWIDAASHLPLKRVFTINDASRKVRVTETYSDFVVNAELDSKHFTLPRD